MPAYAASAGNSVLMVPTSATPSGVSAAVRTLLRRLPSASAPTTLTPPRSAAAKRWNGVASEKTYSFSCKYALEPVDAVPASSVRPPVEAVVVRSGKT